LPWSPTPTPNATIDVGRVRLSDVIVDLDLQYVFNDGRPVTIAAGLGAACISQRTGRAIDRTFIEDALDGVAPSLNAMLAVGVALRSRGGSPASCAAPC
jgi:hypothetical protein